MTRLSQLRLAVMLLTRLPVGRLPEPVPTMAEARWAFPLVGLIVGLIGWAVWSVLPGPAVTASILAVTAMALATGAMHFDGLADYADGIGGGRDRAHVLEIMRDSRIGSYGVLALILVIGAQISAMEPSFIAFVGLAVGSRLAMLAVLEALPPARTDGLGHMAAGRNWSTLIPGIAVIGALIMTDARLLGAVVAMALTGAAVAALARRRIGGQTGDVLGATQVMTEAAGWITLAALSV